MDLVTQASCPQKWAGPSVLLSATRESRAVLAASGWFGSLLEWEKRFPGPQVEIMSDSITFTAVGETSFFTERNHFERVQIELILEDGLIETDVFRFLRDFIPAAIIDEISALPDHDAVTVNANRDTHHPDSWAEIGATYVDVPVNTLPSTRGGALPIISATRWARVIKWPAGLLICWSPATGYWEPDQVRWPHHGVPSHKLSALNAMLDSTITTEQRTCNWFNEATAHELYFLQIWTTELETWESRLFRQLAKGDSAYTSLDLPALQRDIGVLAGYLDRVRVSERFYLRRSDISQLVSSVPGLTDIFVEVREKLNVELRQARESLRSAFELLSSVSQGTQAYAAQESQKTQERLNILISTLTAVLFIPSLVAGIYGANIEELDPGSKGSLRELLGLMFALSVSSIGVLSWSRIGQVNLLSGTVLAIGIGLTFAIVIRHGSSPTGIAVGIGGLVLASLLLVALRVVARSRGERSS